MGLHAIGLIFLLLSAGFFLGWGSVSANGTFDMIVGVILAIIGFSFMTYRNPLADATKKFVRIANQIMDEPPALLLGGVDERVKSINAEARKATRDIKERARIRIEKIAAEVGEITGRAAE